MSCVRVFMIGSRVVGCGGLWWEVWYEVVPGSVELMEASFNGEYGAGGERDIHKGRYVLGVV